MTFAGFFQLIGLIVKFWDEVVSLVKMLNQLEMDRKIEDQEKLREALRLAKTDDERKALAARIGTFGP